MLALYNLTRFPFSVIGTVTVALVEGRIAIVRMQQLLLENEVQQLQEPVNFPSPLCYILLTNRFPPS